MSDINMFFDKNAYLSKYANERRKGGRTSMRKELIYKKSFSSGEMLESFHLGIKEDLKHSKGLKLH